MPPLTGLLQEYLCDAAETPPDGRPLYGYRLPDATDDLARLKTLSDALSERLQGGQPLDRREAAAFCLIMARRGVPRMENRALTWKSLLMLALDAPGELADELLRVHHLPGYADTGLGWWQRSLIKLPASVRYLSSLWCEGGGPLNYIRGDYHAFRSFFVDVLRLHEEYPQRDIESLIREEDFCLRDSLRNETVRDMTQAVIRESVILRRRLRENDVVQDHLTWLDRHDHSWRHRWPFPLDDEMATTLVRPIVSLPRAVPNEPDPRVEVSLDISSPICVLKRTLALPKSLSQHTLQILTGIKAKDQLPQQWWILAVQSHEYPLAKLFRPTTSTHFTVDATRHAPVTGEDASHRVTLLCRRGARNVFTTQNLLGNDPLPDGPWVFEDPTEGNPARYVGGGSWASPSPTLIVALPIDHAVKETQQCKKIGDLSDTSPQRLVYRLSANLDLPFDDGVIRLEVNSHAATSTLFALHGRTMTLGAGGCEVWLGVPSLVICPADGGPVPASADGLQWRVTGEQKWRALSHKALCLGDIHIRYLGEDKSILYHQRLTVIPEQSTIRFLGTDDPHTGRVLLNLGDGVDQVDLANQDEIVATRELAGNLISFNVTRKTPVGQATFRCRVSWGDHRRAELVLAIPVGSVTIHDAAGRSCPAPGPIPSALLDGLTLRATFPQDCEPHLVDRHGEKWFSLTRDTPGSTTFHLPLSAISARAHTLLATEDSLDGVLSLYIRRHSTQILNHCPSIRIQTTAGNLLTQELEGDKTHVDIPDNLRNMPWLQNRRSMQLRRFDCFDEPLSEDIVEQLGDLSWILDRTRLPPTGALAVVKGAGGVCLSPHYLAPAAPTAPPSPLPDAVIRWDEAVRIRDSRKRYEAFGTVINNLTENLVDTDWERMDDLILNALDLPASTYDAVGVIADQPLAAALCAIRTAGRDTRFWSFLEQLKFLWSMVPIRTWIQAIRLYQQRFPDNAAESLRGFLDSAFRHAPSMRVVCALLAQGHTDIVFAHGENGEERFGNDIAIFELPAAMQLCGTFYAQLCDAHQGDRWPGGDEVLGPLTTPAIETFHLEDITAFAKTVVYAPIVAAVRMAYGAPMSAEQIGRLIRYRAFDRDWYDAAQPLMTHFFVQRILAEDPGTFRRHHS